MSERPAKEKRAETDGIDLGMLLIALLSVLLMVMFWYRGWTLPFLVAQTVVISIVLWQACDPFAEAAQWVGRTYRLPGSVRGATLDAIASSLPELFSGIFFVIVMAASSTDQRSMAETVGEGYGSTIATCAGSAIYNMILIPGVCALVISLRRPSRPAIDVEHDVVWRDGLFFLVCEALLLYFLFQDTMHWWMGAAFVALYVLYIAKLQRDARAYRRHFDTVKEVFDEMGLDTPPRDAKRALADRGTRVDQGTVARIKQALRQGHGGDASEDEEGAAGSARVFFHCCRVPLNRGSAWGLLAAATGVAAVACYFLVEAVYATAGELNVAPFFVAVILAAAASSLPDMFLSIGAARRGDDSGAISNAFGSNIFDICICLSLPLLLACFLNGWQPISLLQDGKPMAGLVGLRMLLWVLSLLTLGIIWHKRRVTRVNGIILCGLYCVFIAYAILGSLDVEIFGYSL